MLRVELIGKVFEGSQKLYDKFFFIEKFLSIKRYKMLNDVRLYKTRTIFLFN